MTVTELVNVSLGMIGMEKVPDISTINNVTAEQCRLLWPEVRDAATRAAHWNCATWRQTLATEDSSYIQNEWGHVYMLPTSPYCLKARRFEGFVTKVPPWEQHHPSLIQFRVEGRHLLTDALTPTLVYTRRLEDTEIDNFDAELKLATETLLASFLAVAIRKDYKQSEHYFGMWEKLLSEAIGADESEGQKDEYISADLLSHR